MMCGALLITPYTSNGLNDLFEPGVEFITYEDNNVETLAGEYQFTTFRKNVAIKNKNI